MIAALPQRSGTSSKGDWKAQDFVIETHEQYPKKLVFSVFGAERLERFGIQPGQEINVFFDIDAHEWNGRWFNSVRAYDVQKVDRAANGTLEQPQSMFAPPSWQQPAPQPMTAQTQAAVNMAQQTLGATVVRPEAPQPAQQLPNDLPF